MSLAMAEEVGSTQPNMSVDAVSIAQPYYRLSTSDPHRILLASLIASGTGFMLGSTHGGNMEGLRFRAENAHRLPNNTKGWYLYHKSKNYAVMYSGIKEGSKMATKLGFWVGLFFLSETMVDRIWNDRKDFRSTAITGLTTALAWSRIHGMSRQASGRMIMMGLKAGFGYGLLQDAYSLLNGRKLEYAKIFSWRRKDTEQRRDDTDNSSSRT